MTGTFKYVFAACLAALLSGLLLNTGSALGLPCDGRTVNIGDTMKEVAANCGEAMLKEQRKVTVEETDGSGARSAVTTTTDEWTYNFGPEEQLQTYRFENGKLAGIATSGYGRAVDDMTDNCRSGELLAVGDSYLDTYLKCGEPIAREKLPAKVTVTTEGGKRRVTSVPVVEWTYRYGPDAPGYTLSIENGVVTEIRTREFGK